MKKAIFVSFALLFLFFCTSCTKTKPRELDFFAMDTAIHLQVFGEAAEETAKEMQSQVFAIDAALNRHSNTSAVSALNRGEAIDSDTAHVSALLPLCLTICEATDGAFEPTMAALSDAWQFTSDSPSVPSEATLRRLLKNVGLREHPPLITEETISTAQNVQLDFGAIAKGYTLNCLFKTMQEAHCAGTLDLGGEICVVGKKSDGSPWRVGIKDPRAGDQLLAILSLSDRFVATSGAYERYFERDGIRYHHILDPKTGKPAQSGLISVTVVGEDGAWADALSTALFVLGEDGAKTLQTALAETHPFEYVLVSEDDRVIVSRGLAEIFTLQNGDYTVKTAK